ncbi:MAG: Yip1 family protein [Candidatus Thorarchaeota archaeon]|nr:MAG: hypothetical protein DRP09_02625 [Candidatus Thorarchaeota archaeon]RLI60023.1 MAG: hypothetical protein DRO87_01035 [Candidatus Thorarchaeota archaeon]
MRRCEFCDSPVPADATVCPICKEKIAEETLERILPLLKRPEAPDVRFMGPRERLWGVLRRPAPTYRDIAKKPDFVGPFLVILINALVVAGMFLALSSKVTTLTIVNATSGATVEGSVLASPHGTIFYLTALSGIVASIMLGLLYLIVGGAFAHLAFKLTGGTGNKAKTFSVVGYSILPVVLMRLVGVVVILVGMPVYPGVVDFYASGAIATITPDIVNWAYTSGVWGIIDMMTTASFAWVGYLLIFGIREAHGTSTGWAVVVSLLCMIVLGWTFWQVH